MLLFKRLHFNIVQVRIALLQIGRSGQSLWALAQAALKRGMLVDQEIKGMVERNLMIYVEKVLPSSFGGGFRC